MSAGRLKRQNEGHTKILITMFRRLILAAAFLALSSAALAQEIVYTDASAFPLYGKALEETSARYERLPADMAETIRPDLWYLGRHSAGLYLRFRSNSTAIWARWESTFKSLMNHMTPTGTRGLDLYTLVDGKWRSVNSARPNLSDKETTARIISGMDGRMREYMLYLSLYDGVRKLEIGVERDAVLEGPAVDSPKSDRKIVMYGTSILQGGCANRPGMVFTSILSRRLDREVVNLGFSGNARMDFEIAHLMAAVKNPAVYVFDYVPNSNAERIDTAGVAFFRIVRDAHPEVPVIFVEDPEFTHYIFDSHIRTEVDKKNRSQRALFRKLKEAGEKRIYYVSNKGLIGEDGEACVDGIHFTDLGMVRMADRMTPVLRKALKRSGIR